MITIFLCVVMAYYIRTKISVFYPGLTMIIFFLCDVVMACYIQNKNSALLNIPKSVPVAGNNNSSSM